MKAPQDGDCRPQNNFEHSGWISKLFFTWPQDLLAKGILETIEEKDLPSLMKSESSNERKVAFEKLWKDEIQRIEDLKEKLPPNSPERAKLRPKLHRALIKDFFQRTWIVQPLMALSSAARIAMSLALGYLIQSFVDKSRDGYYWAAVLVFCNAIVLFEHHHVFFITWRYGMQTRIGAVASIFSKSLRLNSVVNDDSKATTGQIMNLVSNDVERFMIATLFISYIIWAPIQAIVILVLGIYLIGPAFAIGIGLLLFIFIPLQVYLSKHFASLRSRVASITDKRMQLISQAINGVRVMKMSAWERELEKRITETRAEEISKIHKANRLKALNEALFFSVNVVISFTIFICHVFVFDGALTTRNVFTIMSLTNVLQIELTKHLSLGVMSGSECWVAMRRIQKYLESSELEPEVENDCSANSGEEDNILELHDVTCHWGVRQDTCDEESTESATGRVIALNKTNLTLKRKDLLCIVGGVGSGKSALLYTLAGELKPSSGTIHRSYKSMSYASQEAWIMNGSIRDNILMGKDFDAKFYQDIAKSTGLLQDFNQLVDGDLTLVGDRGVQLSGGQRARIGLARALYRDAEILLLDDPLSAVDSRVGRLIYYSAIRDLAYERNKCVVLVTHQHQYIGDSRCAYIDNGTLKHVGSFESCVAKSGGKLHLVSQNSECSSEDLTKLMDVKSIISTSEPFEEKKEENDAAMNKESTPRNDQDEKKITGVVTRATFMNYARSTGSIWLAVGLILLFIITQILQLASIAYFGRWSEYDTSEQKSIDIVILVSTLAAGLCIFSFIRSVASFALTLRASKKLHDSMTSAVLRAKIEFFDTNPTGRVLNRFSADVGSNDDLLPHTLFDFFMCAFLVGGSLITAITAIPYILVIIPPLLWYFLRVRNMFVTTSRELKRYEGLARSPIYAMLNESISGIATIRANDVSGFIQSEFAKCHDTHSRAFWSFLASSRWLGFRMDFLMFVNCSVASFLAVLLSERDWFKIDPVIFGLALSMLIQLGSIFQWTIRQSAEVVNQMVCVERVSEYSNLEPEGDLEKDTDKNFDSWPSSGLVQIKDLSLRYRNDLPLSLKKLTIDIPSGKRVGVVGRTGSGKSTLVQALFRILEAENGEITIDGTNITDLGLHKLRTGMSVINQVPVLFSGTVRENLDPFNDYSDSDINDALSDVQMMKAIQSLPNGINSPVASGGSNFSVGERQLLCLARAILQKSRILVLDEPTANVDNRTDKLLQEAVNKSFNDATIISVAHRLDTIIENDFIVVMGNGTMLEYGTPAELIAKKGTFYSMVEDCGEEMADALKKRAIKST